MPADEIENVEGDDSGEVINIDINASKCFFCDKERITRQGRKISCRFIKEKDQFFKKLKKLATEINDIDTLLKIEDERYSEADKLAYHNDCNLKYFSKYKAYIKKPESNEWAVKRDIYKTAREKVLTLIRDEVINGLRALSLQYLKICFTEFLYELHELENLERNIFSTGSINQQMIQAEFKHEIKVITVCQKLYIISKRVDIRSIDDEQFENILFEQEVEIFAAKYRRRILRIQKDPLPDFIDSERLSKGECKIPSWLNIFWTTVLGGIKPRSKCTPRVKRLASCYSQDSIFSVTHGKVKPPKQILLGIAMKTLTGSQKVIDILNRQGYCLSYSNIIELETSAAYSCQANNYLCPSGIYKTPLLCCGVAWNNFDRFVETSSGKNTLHDTVGIIYQNIPTEEEMYLIRQENIDGDEPWSVDVRTESGKRRRTVDFEDIELMREAKQGRLEFINIEEDKEAENTLKLKKILFSWLMSHYLKIQNTPMWIGFNSLTYCDESRVQKIEYLTQINNSPTDPAVIKETMRRSLKIASECGKSFMNVTYDLAIAKIALKIQSAEVEFKPLFIHLGSFHTMMSYFKAIGKFIDGCGVKNMLVDSGILANGSINSFLSGKHFNRCRKVHPLLSLAIQTLHLQMFLSITNYDTDDVKIFLKNIMQGEVNIRNSSLEKIFDEYDNFRTDTLNGKNGKTPQFYMIYVQLLDYYLMMEYSIRSGNVDLYKSLLVKMNNVFFTMNHQNYARYTTIYYHNLNNIENTHPGLLAECKDSFLGIRRTSKSFS